MMIVELLDEYWDVSWYMGFHNGRNDFDAEARYSEREEKIKKHILDITNDLLEACEALVNVPAKDTKGVQEAWEKARAAIAKAKGES